MPGGVGGGSRKASPYPDLDTRFHPDLLFDSHKDGYSVVLNITFFVRTLVPWESVSPETAM